MVSSRPGGPTKPGDTATKIVFSWNGKYCGYHDLATFARCDELVAHPSWRQTNGQLVHIKGDRPGSARYDEKQSNWDRHNSPNLMVMCPKHHTLVDRLRPEDHPAHVLDEMKRRAEDEEARLADPPFWLRDD
ncbi:MAG: hypothetical protein M3487_06075, partial [Actinomycetota bacterium]|nr:hypothetical protein [Actinomycetota bacterium]